VTGLTMVHWRHLPVVHRALMGFARASTSTSRVLRLESSTDDHCAMNGPQWTGGNPRRSPSRSSWTARCPYHGEEILPGKDHLYQSYDGFYILELQVIYMYCYLPTIILFNITLLVLFGAFALLSVVNNVVYILHWGFI